MHVCQERGLGQETFFGLFFLKVQSVCFSVKSGDNTVDKHKFFVFFQKNLEENVKHSIFATERPIVSAEQKCLLLCLQVRRDAQGGRSFPTLNVRVHIIIL